MKINTEIDGKSIIITLTEKQLEEIKKQTEPEKWQDKLNQPNREYSYLIGNSNCNGVLGFYCMSTENINIPPENTFETQEQVQLLANKCNLMIEIHNYAYAVNDGWIPDWTNEAQEKYGLNFYENKIISNSYFSSNRLIFGIAVKSLSLAKEMNKEFDTRLIKFHNQQY